MGISVSRPIAGVTFDAAGTLIRLRRGVGDLYCEVAARFGASCNPEAIERQFWQAYENAPPLCFPGVEEAELERWEKGWWQNVVREAFRGVLFAHFEAFFTTLYDTFADPAVWECYPDVPPALAALRASGRKLAVVSNFDRRLEGILHGLGLSDSFDAIVLSSRVGAAKPHPAIFLRAASELGLPPHQLCHVGDREVEDVAGARSAGFCAFLIARGATASARVLTDLRQLVQRL